MVLFFWQHFSKECVFDIFLFFDLFNDKKLTIESFVFTLTENESYNEAIYLKDDYRNDDDTDFKN